MAGDPADQALQGEPTGPGGHPAHQPQPGVRRPRQDQQAEGGIPSQVYVRGEGGGGRGLSKLMLLKTYMKKKLVQLSDKLLDFSFKRLAEATL